MPIESTISTGESHPTATAAQAPPATPSRDSAAGMIHHHGSEAPTDASTANRLRNLSTAHLPWNAATRGGVPYKSFQVQYPATKTADAQVMAALSRLPRRLTYRT